MWDLKATVSLEDLEEEFKAQPEITATQFMNVVPHLRANYVMKRNETSVLTEYFITALALPVRKGIMDIIMNYDQWNEFNYVLFRFLIKHCRDEGHGSSAFQLFFLNRLLIGLSSKEYIRVTLELFRMYVGRYPIQPTDVVKVMKDAIERSSAESILMNSLTTQFIPCAGKVWGKDFLDELSNAMGKANQAVHLAVLKNLMEMKESNITHETFVEHMDTIDPNCRELIFQTLCRIKKTTYFYNIHDIEFVFNYIETGDPSAIIDNIPYFCSHIFYSGNTKPEKLGSVCEKVFHLLRKIAFALLSGKRGMEQIEVGGFLYHVLTEMIIKNRIKTAYNYAPDYAERESPLYNSLFSKDQLYLGSEKDIHILTKHFLNMDTLVPVLKVLRDIPEIENFVPEEFFLNFLFKRFTDANHLFIEEKLNIFIEFLIDVYHTTYKMKTKFFINWLQMWKNHCENHDKLHMNVYFSLKAMLAAIRRHKLPFQAEYIKLEDVELQIDGLILKHNNQSSREEIRLAERILTGSAELLIDVAQRRIHEGTATIRNVLTKLETIINCNKRYIAATVTLLYKKFVANVSPLNVDFFREYLHEKISLINPEIIKQSKLRRGAEHRAVIHSICAEVPNNCKESLMTGTIAHLMKILTSEDIPTETVTTAIHCINQIMEDGALKKYTHNHIFELLTFCIHFRTNVNFSLSNARYLLFRTLATRILPSVDRRKNLQLNDVFRMYPKLYETTVQMGDSNNFDQNTKILLISFLNTASEMNSIPSSSDYHFNILPICAKMLKGPFDRTVYLVLDLFVSVIPVHDIPVCYFKIVSFLLDIKNIMSVQSFYNHLYILNVLSDKLLLHIETDYCQRSIIKWQKMQRLMSELKMHEQFGRVLQVGLMYDASVALKNSKLVSQNIVVIFNFISIPTCLQLLNTLIDDSKVSVSIKVMAANILLKRVDNSHPLYKNIIKASVIIALDAEPVSHAQNLIIQLIYALSSCEILFCTDIVKLVSMPYDKLLVKTNQCTEYIFLYTYILSYVPEIRVSEDTKRLILKSFYVVEDDEAATVFNRLYAIIKCPTEILLLGLFIVTLSNFEDSYICQSVFNHLNINVDSFRAGIETMFSLPFLKDYLKCPKAVRVFILETISMIVDIEYLVKRDDVLLEKQFECVCKSFRKLLFSLVLGYK